MDSSNKTIIKLIENVQKLPCSKIEEINNYVEFLLHKLNDSILTDDLQLNQMKSSVLDYVNEDPITYSVSDLKIEYNTKG